ncbi:MAG: thioredoxin-disulfide reductase [Campylobacterota bacterium]|nr:thioredoxin-disulfide reductase [Campylobacterota bacterium]
MLDCAIIGGGPGGLTAGLYASRGGLKEVVLFEKGMPGGQITQSSEIENYPGFYEHGKTGMDFMDTWQEQCFAFGLEHRMEEVSSVRKEDDHFLLEIAGGETIQAKTAVIATGSTPKRAGIKGEEDLFGKGVSTCATCDGFFYKNREVAVLGGGDTALEEAHYLSNICSRVYVIHRRDTFRAAPSTVERIVRTENIELITDTIVEEITGDAMGVTGVNLKNKKSGEERHLDVPGIFVFVGHDVNNGILKDESGKFICEVNEYGQVIVDLSMSTSVDGLYAVGDLRIEAPKQVVCAAGDGATAALQVISYIQEQA